MKPALDELLTHPYIWRGRHAPRDIATLSSGHPALDEVLPGGGWPRTGLIEILAERRGTGELRLIVPLLRHFSHKEGTSDRGWIAWIRPPGLRSGGGLLLAPPSRYAAVWPGVSPA